MTQKYEKNIPESARILHTALKDYTEAKGAHSDFSSSYMRLISATEEMFFEICEDMNLQLPKRPSLGHKVQAVAKELKLSYSLRKDFELILMTRNMMGHGSIPHFTQSETDELKERVLRGFEWYMVECPSGPQIEIADFNVFIAFPKVKTPNIIQYPRKIFICYAKEDQLTVETIYNRLLNRGHKPWMDKKNLLPGQNWELEINRAIKDADYFIACMSKTSVAKRGYVQKEMRFALDVLGEIPVGQIFFIPIRLESCQVPPTLTSLQWLDLDSEQSYSQLFEAIEQIDSD